MTYYLIFAALVATVKTFTYYKYKLSGYTKNSSKEQIRAAVFLAWVVSFLLAPFVLLDECYQFIIKIKDNQKEKRKRAK